MHRAVLWLDQQVAAGTHDAMCARTQIQLLFHLLVYTRETLYKSSRLRLAVTFVNALAVVARVKDERVSQENLPESCGLGNAMS